MGKRHRCVMMEAAQERVTIESTESRQIRGARATEGFGIQVQKVSLGDIGLQVIPDTVHLDDGDRRGRELTFNRPPRDISGRVRLHHAFHDHLVFHFRVLQQFGRSVSTVEHADHILERIVSQAFMEILRNAVIDVENADRRIRRVLTQKLGDQRIAVILAGNREPVLSHATVDETRHVSQA